MESKGPVVFVFFVAHISDGFFGLGPVDELTDTIGFLLPWNKQQVWTWK